MSRGINKVFLLGNVGRVDELRKMPNGKYATSMSLATSNGSKDNLITEWHKVVFYDKLAEIAHEYSAVGAKVHVEGYLRSVEYTNKTGINVRSYEVVCVNFLIVDSKKPVDEKVSQEPLTVKTLMDWENSDVPF